MSNAEKEARREKKLRAMRRKKAKQRAYTYRIIVLSVLLLTVVFVWKGVTGITGYIDDSRQQKVDAMQNIDINKDNVSIDVAGQTFAAETTEATVATTEAYDPTHVLSNGRYVDTTKPMVALTWDDGPKSSVGDKLMDLLEANNGRGTFFIVGSRIDDFTDEVKRMAANGHEIANHSWDHDEKLSKNSSDYIQQEFEKTNAKVEEVTGIRPALVRLPGGIISDTVRSTITQPMIFWSIDTLDWKSKNAESVASIIQSEVKDGDIILMHELYDSTLAACQTIIPWLAQQGYQMVTVSELIAFRNADVQGGNGKQYSSFPPKKTETETTVAEASATPETKAASSESSEKTTAKTTEAETSSTKKSSENSETESSKKSASETRSSETVETAASSQEAANDDVIDAPDQLSADDNYTPTVAQEAQKVSETAAWMNVQGSGDAQASANPQADAIQADSP
ncbi:Peptidoglycan/xylan/chitin deacetylase, PgdA/CDA1 family [Oribacterium sp. WCC10]|nr:Peptidoglycan/xylan/chitin deacetylase, PgdA/CDA1 family [Oribacterium sp. WCC10]